ncbi:MAG: dTDP-4-dehydrorhamnose 3,5-epimerase family protein [Gemmatimonadaceae bacterium]|nr:dTDP-4-dehydrorhamnose 3,5-epimerase family protein [Gemmatimonadaceae bacterium]
MRAESTAIPGVIALHAPVHADARGAFVKPFAAAAFDALELVTPLWSESFWTRSKRGVIRGMHLQHPPAAQSKLVWCVAGVAFDVLVDLRAGSPTYGQTHVAELTARHGAALLVPPGVAHGFQSLASETTLVYLVSEGYEPDADGGVRWDSIGVAWPERPVALSARDAALPALADYQSPFVFDVD